MAVRMKKENTFEINVTEDMNGTRIDLVLSLALEETSRSYIQKIIEKQRVFVDGKLCENKKYKVVEGQTIFITIPEPEILAVEPENIPIDIIYEDDDLLVVNKEKGIVVHPAVGNYTGTLVNAIMYHCGGKLSSINGVVRPGIVHRIDKNTSGLLVVAKNDKAHNSLALQFSEHTIERAYHAVVYSNIIENQGTISQPLGRDPKNRLKRAVTILNSKEAITHYKVLERFGKFTYIEARLETGRTHQIRVHMAYINHPLLGDDLYGPKKSAYKVEGQVLHAKTLGFVHPSTGKYMEFDSELPDHFTNILNKIARERGYF